MPGRLVVEDIARRFGMSRTPVREALHRLALLGVVEVAPSGGFVAARFSLRQVAEHYELRILLECAAAALAASRPESRDSLETDDHSTPSSARFHNDLARRSGNKVLERIVRSLNERSISLHLYARGSEIPRAELDAGHEAILASINRGDALAASQGMKAHLELVRDTMLAQISSMGGSDA